MKDAVSRSYPVMLLIFGSVRARVSMEPVTASLRYFINVHIHLLVYLVKTCKFFKVNFRMIVELAVGAKYNRTHRISFFLRFPLLHFGWKKKPPNLGWHTATNGCSSKGLLPAKHSFCYCWFSKRKKVLCLFGAVFRPMTFRFFFFFQILKSPHLAG